MPSDEQSFDLSIVVRTRNEGEALERLFLALRAQESDLTYEVIVVDNESQDNTAAIAEQFGARLTPLPATQFSYGRALNQGIAQAKGQLILVMSAHSLPIGSKFLDLATAPFADPLIAGARCLRADSTQQLLTWFQPRDITYESPEEQRLVESGLEWTKSYPAATCCVLRRSVWEQWPFDEKLESNEDKLWFSLVLSNGYKVRSSTEAVFAYTRKRTPSEEAKRWDRDHLELYRHTGKTPLTWRTFAWRSLRSFPGAVLAAGRYLYSTFLWNLLQVTVPIRAKRSRRVGSLAEFRHRTKSR